MPRAADAYRAAAAPAIFLILQLIGTILETFQHESLMIQLESLGTRHGGNARAVTKQDVAARSASKLLESKVTNQPNITPAAGAAPKRINEQHLQRAVIAVRWLALLIGHICVSCLTQMLQDQEHRVSERPIVANASL